MSNYSLILTIALITLSPRSFSFCREYVRAILTDYRNITPVNDHWWIDGFRSQIGQPGSYNNSFRNVMPNKQTIEEFLSQRTRNNLSRHVLDLFGSAVFLKDPKVAQTLTGVRKKSIRNGDLLPGGYPVDNWEEIEGDLFYESTWNKIKESMNDREISSFDLVTIRPEGGHRLLGITQRQFSIFNESPNSVLAFNAIFLRKAYRLLNPNGGSILINLWELGDDRVLRDIRKWKNLLENKKIEVVFEGNSMRITRRLNSPQRLPI